MPTIRNKFGVIIDNHSKNFGGLQFREKPHWNNQTSRLALLVKKINPSCLVASLSPTHTRRPKSGFPSHCGGHFCIHSHRTLPPVVWRPSWPKSHRNGWSDDGTATNSGQKGRVLGGSGLDTVRISINHPQQEPLSQLRLWFLCWRKMCLGSYGNATSVGPHSSHQPQTTVQGLPC